jgi:3-oxoacyl-[acyl-carrier-protein] synthase III
LSSRGATHRAADGVNAYITSTASFLPGTPVGNDEMEDLLGLVNGRRSRLKSRILKANGIRTRHYAIDRDGRTTHSNADMGVAAARQCLERAGVARRAIGLLSCATSQGDLVLPGFASMVQAGLDLNGVEILTTHGVCSCSLMAVKAAANSLRLGDHSAALVVASELASRLFKHTRYEAAGSGEQPDFDAEFLRWMLSDGAGAWLLEARPKGPALRIDWIRSFSHADAFPVCMSVGRPGDPDDQRTWQDFPTYGAAEAAGALLIRQDVRLLDNIVKLGVDGTLRLIEEGCLDISRLDHLLCHYSSHHFRSQVFDMLRMAGAAVPEEKWYTNLYDRGNTGCASIFIMLDDFLSEGRARIGDTILCVVPESGRFNTAYMHLTMVEPS